MKRFFKWVLIIVCILFIGFSYYISDQVANGVTHLADREESSQNSLDFLKKYNFDLDKYKQEFSVEVSQIASTHGDHQIPVLASKTKSDSKGTVILIHGLGASKESTLIHGRMFQDLGYDIVAYDQRSSGDNVAETNTFGVLESKDLIDLVDWVSEKISDPDQLIVWGESFGGITAGIASDAIQDKIDGLILDSPMENGRTMVDEEMAKIEKESGLPAAYMTVLGDWNLRLLQGFSLSESDVTNHIQKVKTPLLVFHSKDDSVIPFEMGQAIYQASPAQNKKMIEVDQGEHAMLVVEQPDLYRQSLEEFLENIQ